MRTGKKILVVDDDQTVRDVLKTVLQTRGYDVQCAGTGESALKTAAQNRFDAVIADYYLPGRNGAELALALQALYPHIVVIGMSGGCNGRAAFSAVNGTFFLEKPIAAELLLFILDGALSP